ncbi:polysaccharide biosynthesis protein [Flaviramulus sp. BrNp1-15]|uniref:polysaccharide biosynthesis protein n=1 Tax=Flaviramulus sp. BrNp1-15 TaxID=2916754 RepID=UPI001EE84716|nr:polysaccharide biosynthesis protein [Flaviramulus sp. BrNp1-15]ULC58259.1 polysaccharide biosynthesis protein [Flaviramulus sp. BrNp1-15]
MEKSTSKQIDQLLIDSGLFHSNKKVKKLSNKFDFSNETILVTGAAGSIGSELTKQLVKNNYKKLILIDIAESPLYHLIKDLEFKNINDAEFKILNICEKESLTRLFEVYKPTIIFHAAAYKHVPLMESNPYEAVKTNILATKFLADLSVEYGVKKFIFISTDKAVNPINVMGISKFIAESYLNSLPNNNTLFITTRFGNILGSNGSVLQLLKKQIETNCPITITNKTVSRYFINEQKACSLILKIANSDNLESQVFTFNMGEPIRIMHLVERLLALYKIPKDNIEIKTTGLRPGEKLHEDIISNDEELVNTSYEDILIVKKNNKSKNKIIDFTQLLNISPYMANSEIKSILKSYL